MRYLSVIFRPALSRVRPEPAATVGDVDVLVAHPVEAGLRVR
jgi:hypothetical protein